jgi:hypothetical protein
VTTTITDLDDFKALDPFFRIIEDNGGVNRVIGRRDLLLGRVW